MVHQAGSSAEAFIQSVELEEASCPLNCPPNDEHVLTGRDLLHDLPGEFNVVKCSTCGLMRTSPRPTPSSIGAYYPSDYGPYQGTRVEAGARKGGSTLKARLISVAKALFDTKAHALPVLLPGRMLEIGCASGSFLHEMAGKGWDVEGIEFSPEAAAEARKLGYPVETGALESMGRPSSRYDLIVGWMVLEHLHSPVESLRKLATWAGPSGSLVLSVPNSSSLVMRLFEARWYDLHLPNHLYHFDADTISQVLGGAGWEITDIHHHRTLSNFLASAGYVARENGMRRIGAWMINFAERGGRMSALVLFIPALVMSWFGQTGRMTVWARRKS